MSIYHCSIKIIGRSQGRSAVASSAYRSGTKLHSEETNKTFNYTAKGGVVHSEVMLCENAPKEYLNRQVLWNAVQKIEKNNNAQLAREIEVALPNELSRVQQIKIVRDYVQRNFVDNGMCADWALHDKKDGNPHAHIMLTTRPIKKNGEWGVKEKKVYKLDEYGEKIPKIDSKTGKQKIETKTGRKVWERVSVDSTAWNDRGKAEEWRKAWAEECNKYLDTEKQIDHRSYKRQGIDIIPTIHEGTTSRDIEKNGGISKRCNINRNIKRANTEARCIKSEVISNAINGIRTEIEEIRAGIQDENKRQAGRYTRATDHLTALTERIRGFIERIRRKIRSITEASKPVIEEMHKNEPETTEGVTVDWEKEELTISYQGNVKTINLFSSQWSYKNLIEDYQLIDKEEQELIKVISTPKKLEERIKEFEAQRKQLGPFQGKQKKEIDKQIQAVSSELAFSRGKAEAAKRTMENENRPMIGLAKHIVSELTLYKHYAQTHKSSIIKQSSPTPAQEQKRDIERIAKEVEKSGKGL